MAKRDVVWTETAAKQRREILRYWALRNGLPTYSIKLIKLITYRVNIILRNPNSFKETTYPHTRVSAMGHFSIFYKIADNHLIITAFWDNRQDPEKLLELIKGLT